MKLSTRLIAAGTLVGVLALNGCLVRSGYYGPGYYGYSNVAQPNTVYYGGGYHNRVYYQPGYYQRTAPFVTYAAPARPVYVQPGYVQPTYVQPSYGVGGSVYVH